MGRRILPSCMILLVCQALAQQPQTTSTSPDVTLVIHEHATGADMVQVTMSHPDYPPELLRDQLIELGAALSSPPRGLALNKVNLDPSGKNPNLTFVKSSFAIDGIIDRAGGRLYIEPILKAFAGAPEPYTIDSLLIVFDKEKPGPRTVKKHESDSVSAVAEFVPAPAELEYRIQLKTQDPSKISFPSLAPEPTPASKPSGNGEGPSALFYAALVAAALAAGALVYLALARGSGPVRR